MGTDTIRKLDTHVFDYLDKQYFTFSFVSEGEIFKKIFQIVEVDGSELKVVVLNTKSMEVQGDTLDARYIYDKKFKKRFHDSNREEKKLLNTWSGKSYEDKS